MLNLAPPTSAKAHNGKGPRTRAERRRALGPIPTRYRHARRKTVEPIVHPSVLWGPTLPRKEYFEACKQWRKLVDAKDRRSADSRSNRDVEVVDDAEDTAA